MADTATGYSDDRTPHRHVATGSAYSFPAWPCSYRWTGSDVCCVSKARHAPECAPLCQAPDSSSSAIDNALAAELAGLKPSQLRKRAEALGVDAEDIDEAWDADDRHGALGQLIVAASPAPSVQDDAFGQLRAELRGLKPSGLRKRARAIGVDEALLEEAEDGPTPAESVIELILEKEAPAQQPAAG